MAAELALEDGVQSLSLSDNAAPTPTGHASLPNGISSPSALSAQELAPHGEPAGKRPTPRFFPPLWLGRRTACLEVLKREGIRSVGPAFLLPVAELTRSIPGCGSRLWTWRTFADPQ